MLAQMIIDEIMSLKGDGYTKKEIIAHFESQGEKPPSIPTLNKYFKINAMPNNPMSVYAKEKAFDREPFREAIIKILVNCGGDCHTSSIYDVLEEIFVDDGRFEALPGNEQTLRNYVKYLYDSKAVEFAPKAKRIYDHVFDTPPGEQMLIDFGEYCLKGGKRVYFICLLLRYSRLFCVYAQDHRYNAEEACRDIYRAFRKLGGRPKQLVIDQDAVFVASETYGEVIETRTFGDFCKEQDLRCWVCNKEDPESKGGVENLVGFVKKNYFSARADIVCVEEVLETLPGWVERKGRRIHKATYCIPIEVFENIERSSLRQLIPSVYENLPSSYRRVDVKSTPYILYRASKYSVPRKFCFNSVLIKEAGGKLHVYDEHRKFICTHILSDHKGSFNQLSEHKKDESEDWKPVAERLRSKWNCYDFQHFINGFKKENPRHLYQQLSAVEAFLNAEQPEYDLVANVMRICCEKFRYKFTQFRDVYSLVKSDLKSKEAYTMMGVQKQTMDAYQKAFEVRCIQ